MDATTEAPPRLTRGQTRKMLDRYRVTSGKGFRLKDHDPADTIGHVLSKPQAEAMLAHDVHRRAVFHVRTRPEQIWPT